MLTKINLTFESTVDAPVALEFLDRTGKIAAASILPGCLEINFDISFPNRLRIQITGIRSGAVRLNRACLGLLELPKSIIQQICIFQATDTNAPTVTPNWHTNGEVCIDFFANNFIEYHLLYGNRFDFEYV